MARAADVLVLNALDELLSEGTAATLSSARSRTLGHALETLATSKQIAALRQWHSAAAVMSATQSVEDELLSTQRALRRAHASLAHSLQQAAVTS